MIGPSLKHMGLVVGLQWLTALPFILLGFGLVAPLGTGLFFAGVWLGREFEQLWPHAETKPLPDDLTVENYNRFIRQGGWPVVGAMLTVLIPKIIGFS